MMRWLAPILQPSVTRRLVLAQLATLAMLWVALLGYSQWQVREDAVLHAEDQARQGAAISLSLLQILSQQPERLHEVMEGIDRFQRSLQAPTQAQAPYLFPVFYLWWDNQMVYRSPGASEPPQIQQSDRMFRIELDRKVHMVYSESSADGRGRFLVMAPWDDMALGVTMWSQAWLVLPLLVCLPLLVLPAWCSVWLALRPWRRVSQEIEARGPENLSPLTFFPKHRELRTISHAVDRLLAGLRAARVRERSFIADAAHELRTPIAAIQVHTEALLTNVREQRDAELLAGLYASNTRAARLVEQLLALSRTESAQALQQKVPVDLEALVQDSLAQLAPLAYKRSVELDFESDGTSVMNGDAGSLRSLFDNVIGNAVKYSPAGTAVRVRLRGDAQSIRLTVIDEGIGIPHDLRERVFDRFFRVPDQKQVGSGLGLAIAKAAADRHDAQLELADGPDAKGLVVIFTVKRAR